VLPDRGFGVRAVVVLRPKPNGGKDWPGYFDLFGSIDDETFVRPPQSDLPLLWSSWPAEIGIRQSDSHVRDGKMLRKMFSVRRHQARQPFSSSI
jgi:hypothetical protein